MSVEIELKGISKRFGDQYAVKDLSFRVGAGELFALLGPSGAGKTTTLNLLGGLEEPDTGDILENGVSIRERKPQDRNFAMVFESYALYPHLTVAQNMSFPLRAPVRKDRFSDEDIKRRVRETARMLDMEDLLHRYPRELSGGQKQRVGLGRALIRSPKLFLMDEPITHLDAKLRHQMRGELKKVHKQLGVTTVLATPDHKEMVAMADRAAILNQGEIQQIGSPLELFNRPRNEIVANAIGAPPINIITAEIASDGRRVHLQGKGFSFEADDRLKQRLAAQGTRREVRVGIRPRDIIIEKDSNEGALAAEVYVFEPLGGEAVATLTVNGLTIKVACSPDRRLKIGDKVGLSFSVDDVHLFDAETGESFGNQGS